MNGVYSGVQSKAEKLREKLRKIDAELEQIDAEDESSEEDDDNEFEDCSAVVRRLKAPLELVVLC